MAGTASSPIGQMDASESPTLWWMRSLFGTKLGPPQPPKRSPLHLGVTIIGRETDRASPDGDPGVTTLVIAEPSVSQRHALITVQPDGKATLRDAGSRHGTCVNGRLLTADATHPLRDGDVLRMGGFVASVHCEPATIPDARVPTFLGTSRRAALVRQRIVELAPQPGRVLITGETGTGKEVAAKALHQLSPRRDSPFVAFNGAALPEDLADSELFGHVRSAFTGATAREGLFRAAGDGTLLIDEVGELSPRIQAKLLRTLQEGTIRPVGADHDVRIKAHVLSATLRDLAGAVAAGEFREDLYARLNVHPLVLPPLRARREDILTLLIALRPRTQEHLRADLVELLLLYPWPRNVRELDTVGQRLEVEGFSESIRSLLTTPVTPPAAPSYLADPVRGADESAPWSYGDLGRDRLEELLIAHQGNVVAIAKVLGCSRSPIERWLKQYGLQPARYRKRPR